MMESISCCKWFLILLHLLFSAVASAKHHGNPANELVNIIKQNRTLEKLPQLNGNAGLSCIALQYVEHCNCTSNSTLKCKPSENDFTEVFAPNCGVELPTFGTITGRIVGCQSKYVEPLEAFSRILVRDHKTLSVLRDKNHSEVGVGLIGNHHGPFFGVFYLVMIGSTRHLFLKMVERALNREKGVTVDPTLTAVREREPNSYFWFPCFL